ncbi:hypothetical protein [Sphingobium sp. YR768]|uniref:hypothetical protein n=1 Tax=Sphingobium sp. YR768 TaxID=1884365 RepID=UPI0008B8CD65|nr:hypothetical protein [Sphingobium sp. YR768]SES03763.1 hypothetical protein SAMN05518866_13321 [Sphingobium sp. YR768]
MDWVPVFLIIFKLVVLGLGMFFAVKWHYDKDRKAQKAGVLGAVGKIAAILMILLPVLLFATFTLARTLGLDLTLPG